MNTQKITKAHCNDCGQETNHDVLHSESSREEDDEGHGVSWGHDYDTLKCRGCELVKLRYRSWFSEVDEDNILYFPPAIFRAKPKWFDELSAEIEKNEAFVEVLLNEIYVATQNNLTSLATMGVRALLERVMISRSGDQGSFGGNIAEFERLGHVSKLQRERLEAILEAGHAAMHRAFTPEADDVSTLLDITEHIIESVFLHEKRVNALKKRLPVRPPRS